MVAVALYRAFGRVPRRVGKERIMTEAREKRKPEGKLAY